MDTYLALAERVLRAQKRALSALEMVRIAYRDGLAPLHIRGATQHKTLQARLSEDILRYRGESRFYRTAPGKFFLHSLRDDPDVPNADRVPIIARRRKRDLPKYQALAFKRQLIDGAVIANGEVPFLTFLDLVQRGCFHYAASTKTRQLDEVVVWSFAIVIRDCHILSYRAGPYREQRDSFTSKRVIGFYSPVVESDLTLFDQADHGIVWSGMKALASDLDMYDDVAWQALNSRSKLQRILYPDADSDDQGSLLALVSFACPDWLEPTSSRLAVNDLSWIDMRSPINHVEDLDPWSKALLPVARQVALAG